MNLLKIIAAVVIGTIPASACTSMIVSARASADGRPMLWKHRDTGTEHNFIERVPARDGQYGYVALFNGGDSLLREAWMGMNDAGFAIMNTASYNLAPDTAKIKDREGIVMSLALQRCVTAEDFAAMLDTLPRPMGVQANFGVLDAEGRGGYFETNDTGYTYFDIAEAPDGVLCRTNFSFTGNDKDGMGYIRYDNAIRLMHNHIANADIRPEHFTEGLSRSFYHSLLDKDFLADTTQHWAVDQDFIPRYSSSASIVIVMPEANADPSKMQMHTVIGYPAVGTTQLVTLENIPEDLRPTAHGWRSPACNASLERKRQAFPIRRGSGRRYVNLDYIRSLISANR